MSLPPRARGVKVLKAVSSPLRLQILNLLFDKGSLSYTELMNQLKMNPSRDAGRFAYHLKFLLKASLVEVDSDAKKYYLTDLGKMVIDVADRVEKKAVRTKGMMVRTSHFTLEEFDANKIANSLIREAKMPADEAQKTAKETEKLLLKSKIKYLTAPLIREIVNATLIEKGLEDYRHKLTRLGLPVHEVTALVEGKNPLESGPVLATAGKSVLREYMLLNVFPRDIADTHVSGGLHVNGLSTWVLKPSEVMHDLRFFLQGGLRLDCLNTALHQQNPPKSFEAALATVFSVLSLCQAEVTDGQTVGYFNVFLAPYAKDLDSTRIKDAFRLFLINVSQIPNVTLGLTLKVPKYISEKYVVCPKEKETLVYGDFEQEAKLLASCILEVHSEESTVKPIFNPGLNIRVSSESLEDEVSRDILLKAHGLAAAKGAVYFSNALVKASEKTAFSASGVKLGSELTEDWETDTMRTGCLGSVTLNLPRIVTECEKDKTRFMELLKERCELALRALGIKHRALKQYGKTALPFLTQSANGDPYFRLENSCGIVNLAGFIEAVEAFTGKPINQMESVKFAAEIVQTLQAYVGKIGRKHGKRLAPSILHSLEASSRLAQLDVEKYGVAKVSISGTREKPYYSTTRRLKVQAGNFMSVPTEELDTERNIRGLNAGANLSIVELGELDVKPEDLAKLTQNLMENHKVEFLTFNRAVTFCQNCRKSWIGSLHKCPSCSSIGSIVPFDRYTGT